jgi:aminoglycoside phosphotransferase (APT) family kinase protein
MGLVSHDQIRAIWRRHGLGRPQRIAPTSSGVRNECYVVDEAYVLRLNTLDPQFPKFRSESVAYRLLQGSGLPVPAVVALDESRQVVPYDYIVVTRLPGVDLARSWTELTPAQVERLTWEAGRCLARLHQLTFEGFGKLRDLGQWPFATWFDEFADYAGRYLRPAWEHGLVDDATLRRLERALDRTQGLLGQVRQGVLVHCDYHYENVLQDGGQLTGLLDFEWALSGDPSYDFVAAPSRERMIPGSEGTFVQGYGILRPLDDDHSRRVQVYRLFLALESAVMHYHQGERAEVCSALREVERLLHKVERP